MAAGNTHRMDIVPGCVKELFTQFIKPFNVLHHLQSNLPVTKENYKYVEAETENKGDIMGARLLFTKLVEHQNWFHVLLKVLRNDQVKLQHIADLMEACLQRCSQTSVGVRNNGPTSAPVCATALYIEYTSRLEAHIREIFINLINPDTVLHVFHKYNRYVLTKMDVENVEARVQHHGALAGANLLLDRLILYDDWFSVLLKVLADDGVKLQHVVIAMEAVTSGTRQWYEEERIKLNEILRNQSSRVDIQVTQSTPILAGSGQGIDQAEGNSRRDSLTDEYESDSAEIRHGANISSLCKQMADVLSLSERDGHFPVQAGISVDGVEASQETQFFTAAKNGNVEVLRSLIDQGADVNVRDDKGRTALIYTAIVGDLDSLRYLLDQRADVNVGDNDCRTALMYAANNCHAECVKLLIRYRCDVDKVDVNGNCALMAAINQCDINSVKFLIRGNADVTLTNYSGVTALMLAAKNGSAVCVTLLLEARCDPDIRRNSDGQTALMFASHSGHSDCIKLLIQHNCDVNLFNNQGVTALIFAARSGHLACLELLIEEGGADVDLQDAEGTTAIMIAIAHNQIKCVKLLIRKNADLNLVNSAGYTALTAARERSERSERLILRAIQRR